jgi:putative transposase
MHGAHWMARKPLPRNDLGYSSSVTFRIDYVHLLIELPPKVAISLVVNSLKTVMARMMRRDHEAHLKQFYWNPVLWSRSYFIASCGGAPLETIRKYIESQDSP